MDAISSRSFLLIFPTFSLFGSPDPFSIFAALIINVAAGGVLVM